MHVAAAPRRRGSVCSEWWLVDSVHTAPQESTSLAPSVKKIRVPTPKKPVAHRLEPITLAKEAALSSPVKLAAATAEPEPDGFFTSPTDYMEGVRAPLHGGTPDAARQEPSRSPAAVAKPSEHPDEVSPAQESAAPSPDVALSPGVPAPLPEPPPAAALPSAASDLAPAETTKASASNPPRRASLPYRLAEVEVPSPPPAVRTALGDQRLGAVLSSSTVSPVQVAKVAGGTRPAQAPGLSSCRSQPVPLSAAYLGDEPEPTGAAGGSSDAPWPPEPPPSPEPGVAAPRWMPRTKRPTHTLNLRTLPRQYSRDFLLPAAAPYEGFSLLPRPRWLEKETWSLQLPPQPPSAPFRRGLPPSPSAPALMMGKPRSPRRGAPSVAYRDAGSMRVVGTPPPQRSIEPALWHL